MAPCKYPILLFVSCFMLLLGRTGVFGANVLISAIYGEGSIFMAAAGIGEGLVQRGHNVTVLISNAYAHRATDPKYSNFTFEIFNHPVPAEDVYAMFNVLNEQAFDKAETQMNDYMSVAIPRLVDDCEAVLTDKALMKRLATIDVIVMEVEWPCGVLIKGVLEKDSLLARNISMIAFLAIPPSRELLRSAGTSFNNAYQPDGFTGYSSRMTLRQRTWNVLQSILSHVAFESELNSMSKISSNVGLIDNFYMSQEYQNFDLYLLNSDIASDFVYPLTPNVIMVGGLTARPAGKLSRELEDFMNSSGDDGVVVFSLGTYFASVTVIKPEIVGMFIQAFRRMPQKVLWQLKDLPAGLKLPLNVNILPWLPQNDLLGHPKTRVLLYQGGNNGFQEASYHGVPLVALPLHIDQYDVAARIEARGMGRVIDKHNISADVIYDTLTDVITNPGYTIVAKQVSAITKDQPMMARERAAFWIEHVIEHGGAHLRSTANELSFIQYYMLDVISLLVSSFSAVCFLIYLFLRFCFSVCCRFLTKTKAKRD